MFLTYANYDVLDKQYAHLDFDDYFYRKKNWDIIYIHKVEGEYLNRRLSLHHYNLLYTNRIKSCFWFWVRTWHELTAQGFNLTALGILRYISTVRCSTFRTGGQNIRGDHICYPLLTNEIVMSLIWSKEGQIAHTFLDLSRASKCSFHIITI